jgi:hypothetical protein
MPQRKLPDTDKERIDILQVIIDQEELKGYNYIFSLGELQELRNFLLIFEGAGFCFSQSLDDEEKACRSHNELFKNVQLYISHFIQVLYFSVIRNEIKAEYLALYGLDGKNLEVPDLSTEATILEWGERLIKGEQERIYRGGIPVYNPAIAKVKVHFDLFKDSLHSVKIYRQNTVRHRDNMQEYREKANRIITDAWRRIEDKYSTIPIEEKRQIFKSYKINIQYVKGVQLNVFD